MNLIASALAIQFLSERCASFQPISPLHLKRNINSRGLPVPLPLERTSRSALYMAKAKNANPKVIYQKVIRRNPKNQMFLPSLIDYIQTQFEVPKDLPMIYTSTVPDSKGDGDNSSDGYSILELDSPLSRNSDLTRMEIEVVGIYTDKDNEGGSNMPSMAMVVVKKMNLSETGDLMMKRMFDDSESKIVKVLDSGLDDFIDGKIQVGVGGSGSANGVEMATGEWSALDSLDDYEGFNEGDGIMEDLMVASTGKRTKNIKAEDGIVDAVVTNIEPEESTGDQIPPTSTVEKPTETKSPEVEDFAVQAAKIAAAKREKSLKEKEIVTGGDFAVESAKVAAKARGLKKQKPKKKKEVPPQTPAKMSDAVLSKEVRQGDSMELPTTGVSPMLKNLGKKGKSSFQVKISTPDKFTKRNKVFDKAIANAQKDQHTKDELKRQRKVNLVNDSSVDASSLSEDERQKDLDSILFRGVSTQEAKSPEVNIEDGKITKSDEEIEQDVLKAAMNIMPGSVGDESEKGMTAEELLKDILKFGDEQEKEELDGSGFVKGAFSKAKEITNNGNKVGVKELSDTADFVENIKYEEDSASGTINEKLSAEEELKRIFAAGESIAEGRIARSMDPQQNSITDKNAGSDSVVTDQYVDELIEADKTVPGNARTLDDELAELELRISKSPGEDTEAFGPNALFDVFSGPEVYNPNVDPLTSVNWPGAQVGTRTDVRLPPELSEAVKSANFASRLLSKMVEEEQDDETKVFYIDGKKISNEQVERLQRAVDEGVTVGLIQDPIQYMKERSRLDMLVNELVTQPEERFDEISTFYKDLLLSDNFVTLLKEKLREMANSHVEMQRSGEDPTELEEKHSKERHVLGKLVKYSQLLLKEVQALGAELEATQVEVIRSICKVAMNPDHKTEEETAEALTDAVRDIKPLLDESFVAYLKYAISEEQGRLARAGVLDDPEHNRWLFVLQIVQEGVYAELAVGVKRYIDHISYVLRMDTKRERRQLVSKLIDVMPSMVRLLHVVGLKMLNMFLFRFFLTLLFNTIGCQTFHQGRR
jgi:hypothetical protein